MNDKMKVYILFVGAISLVTGQSTNVHRCELYDAPMPINTYLEGCINTPCPVRRGETAVINIAFRTPHTIRKMRTMATALVFGGTTGYDLGDDAITCNNLVNTYCPVLKDEIVMYQLRMYIQRIWPPIPVIVEFRIEDDNNAPIMCVRIPITVLF